MSTDSQKAARKRYAQSAKGKLAQQKWRAGPGRATVERVRLKCRYGITDAELVDLILRQNGVCGVCKEPGVFGGRDGLSFVVDHDHATRKVRGILHMKCNAGLGAFDDSPAKLRRAAEYLEELS